MTTSHDEPTPAQGDNGQGQAQPPGQDAVAGAASIDKVRDILFGRQMRDFERRFARLEERLIKETSDLKADLKAQLGALERYATSETASLGEQLKAEHDDRIGAQDSHTRDLHEAVRVAERRAAALDEQLAKAQREIRQQMLEQHQRLNDDIRSKIDDVLATLAREAQVLRADKTDRSTLAALLTEMAMRLTNDFEVPGAGDGAHG